MPRQSDGSPGNVTSIARLRGKVVETGQAVEINQPRRRKRRKGWRDHVSLLDVGLMTKLEMSGLESRVFWSVMAHIPEKGGTEARCSLAEIAEQTRIDVSNVSKIMKTLRERHIVHTERAGLHHVTPWIAYNGDFDSWSAEADEWPEPVWARGVNVKTGEVT